MRHALACKYSDAFACSGHGAPRGDGTCACQSGYGGSDCSELLATCADSAHNGDEMSTDCGGSCPPCPTCEDSLSNGDEVGVDCGGLVRGVRVCSVDPLQRRGSQWRRRWGRLRRRILYVPQ